MPVYSQQFNFASGTLVGTRTDVAPSTPETFGTLQDVSLDFTADLKELYGQYRYAIALAPGKTKIEIKAKIAGIRGKLFNDIYFGNTQTATETLFALNELASVPGSTAYTVAASNAAAFLSDEGVFYQTGLPLTYGTVLSAAGQYEVNNSGTYTFDSLDASAAVALNYTYSSAGGVNIAVGNQFMGSGPAFKIMLAQLFDGRQTVWTFNNCKCSKLSMPTKQDDFTIYELDFMVAADGSNNIGTISSAL